jgi:N-acyl-D-aspartate/D-glutamate deacylase
MITSRPAALFGLVDRGVLREGARADVVVFDPASIGAGDAKLVRDLPGDSARLTTEAHGVRCVLVNGVAIVVDGQPTGATPGTLLRSGRDTTTVS